MNEFLKNCRKLIKLKNLCWIVGNESCDLDSAISSISLAFYYHHIQPKIYNEQKFDGFIPLFNIPRQNFPLKTEVTFFLKKNSIDFENLIFIDEIDKTNLENNSVILVDHHVSPYFASVIEVFDHRPFDSNSNLNQNCTKTIMQIGSCSTLIGSLFLKQKNSRKYEEILNLLYAPIVLDTVNFSKEADKAKELDVNITEEIENVLNVENVLEYREKLFNELITARADVSTLDSYQILFKDMKLLTSKSEKYRIALPGFPILVQEYVEMKSCKENLEKFASNENCCMIILIGMKCIDTNFKRDLGLINISNIEIFNKISNSLETFSNSYLNLEENNNCNISMGKFFNQNNVKASRKQILPIVKSILDEM